tara:strand:- start:1503 stop:1922 length:420 start_codon:yes stop_codon:yes gene_type:complete
MRAATQLAMRCSLLSRTAPALAPALRTPVLAICRPGAAWQRRRLFSGRAAADHLSDTLQDANLLLSDLADDDDRSSEDFKQDLEELRGAYGLVMEAYESALEEEGSSQAAVKKNFELAVVGLRDKLSVLEAEAEAGAAK